VTAGYVVKGRNKVGIRLGAYDPSLALVIHPTVAYSTYLGGSDGEQGYGIAVDAAGDAYVTGVTTSHGPPDANRLAAKAGSRGARRRKSPSTALESGERRFKLSIAPVYV
jgi:hypothetical protein